MECRQDLPVTPNRMLINEKLTCKGRRWVSVERVDIGRLRRLAEVS